jgi:hypothetical protein
MRFFEVRTNEKREMFFDEETALQSYYHKSDASLYLCDDCFEDKLLNYRSDDQDRMLEEELDENFDFDDQ